MALGTVLYRPAALDPTDALSVWAEQIRARQVQRATTPSAGTVDDGPRRAASRDASRDDASISSEARRRFDAERLRDPERLDREQPVDEGRSLGDGEQQTVRELESRDREVRAHEQAHKAAAGDLAVGGPSYSYQTGPDGKRYAIGGEVKIRLRSGRTPEETVRNMERAIRAANAPESPSGADRAVAAKASQLLAEARREADAPRRTDERRPAGIDVIA